MAKFPHETLAKPTLRVYDPVIVNALPDPHLDLTRAGSPAAPRIPSPRRLNLQPPAPQIGLNKLVPGGIITAPKAPGTTSFVRLNQAKSLDEVLG